MTIETSTPPAPVTAASGSARRISLIAFTERGLDLARRIAASLEAPAEDGASWKASVAQGFGEGRVPLASWTASAWESSDALAFIGATGIAVRAVAPHVKSKLCDPAVVVLSENGQWAIPLLSGHVGGANRLAERIATAVGATAVVTTATDGRGLWAVDEWAARRNMAIANPARIKAVSGRLLAGKQIVVRSDVPIEGRPPRGVGLADAGPAHVRVTPFRQTADEEARSDGAAFEPLSLVPRCIVAGVGCRRGTSEPAIAAAVAEAFSHAGLDARSLGSVASIDIKKDEAGLAAFCKARGVPFNTYSADELSRVEGSVSASEFVKSTVGVDNVCERAALAQGGRLVAPKRAGNGVTVALAMDASAYRWEEK